MRRQDMYGCILAHRWFSDGEGWAYHPDIKPMLPVLAEQLAPVLTRRQSLPESAWQSFRLEVPGGMLLGIHKRDDNCADQRARGRVPSILVAIYLSGPPAPGELPWKSLLGAHVPQSSGPNIRMRLEEARVKTINRWRKWFMRALVLAVLLSVIAFVAVRGQEEKRFELRDGMQKVLEQTRGGVPGTWVKGRQATWWKAFASVYCISDRPAESAHPDAHWAKSLLPPTTNMSFRYGQPQWRHYTKQLNDWSKHLRLAQILTVHSSGAEAVALLQEIVSTLDYSTWLRREMDGNPELRKNMCTGREPVVEELRARAIAAGPKINPQAIWQVAYAQACFKLLDAWNVREVIPLDVDERPWFVIQAFFAFLNRERFEPLDEVHTLEAQFVRRLPATNVLHEMKYNVDNEEAVKQGLAALIMKLTGRMPGTSVDLSSAVGRIGDSMNYDTWFHQRDGLIQGLKEKQRAAIADKDYLTAGRIAEECLAYEVKPSAVGTHPAMDEFISRFKEGGQP